MFTLTEPKWIVNDSFIFIQKFCKFLRDVAEVYVPYSGYVPPQALSLDNLILDKLPNSGGRIKYNRNRQENRYFYECRWPFLPWCVSHNFCNQNRKKVNS